MERQAYIRPSGGTIWSVCAGYPALNAAVGAQFIEEVDNEIREDGIACHWLAKEVWDGNRPAVGSLSPNDREITDEMYQAVEEYHALVKSWPATNLSLEQTIPVSRYFPGVADGTPDVWGYAVTLYTLYVGDLKFGYRPVEVWRLVQLIIYAWTLMEMIPECQLAKLYIYQPRCPHRDGPIRQWEVSRAELQRLAEQLKIAAAACYAPNPPCTVNPGCRNCGAAYACRTLQAAANGGVEISYDATPFELNNDQLGYELAKQLAAQKHIEHRITGLSMQAETLIKRGQRVPGFEMGRSATRWRWRRGMEDAVRRLGEMFDVQIMADPKLKTVAQIRDSLPAGIAHQYAEKPEGELKLRLIDPNEATRKFSK